MLITAKTHHHRLRSDSLLVGHFLQMILCCRASRSAKPLAATDGTPKCNSDNLFEVSGHNQGCPAGTEPLELAGPERQRLGHSSPPHPGSVIRRAGQRRGGVSHQRSTRHFTAGIDSDPCQSRGLENFTAIVVCQRIRGVQSPHDGTTGDALSRTEHGDTHEMVAASRTRRLLAGIKRRIGFAAGGR
jgi:hypothetical protein